MCAAKIQQSNWSFIRVSAKFSENDPYFHLKMGFADDRFLIGRVVFIKNWFTNTTECDSEEKGLN